MLVTVSVNGTTYRCFFNEGENLQIVTYFICIYVPKTLLEFMRAKGHDSFVEFLSNNVEKITNFCKENYDSYYNDMTMCYCMKIDDNVMNFFGELGLFNILRVKSAKR